MSTDREHGVTEAFVRLANGLVGEFDVIELLSGLTTECAELLDIASAGLLLADERGVLHVVAASSEATRLLEVFQLQREQGPCLDCFRTGQPVSIGDLEEQRSTWPQFVEVATSAGFASVHAVPMRLQTNVLGTLGLFGSRSGALDDDDLELAQALAHVASIALVHGSAPPDPAAIGARFSSTLRSRARLEQAKGLLSHVGALDMDQAFGVLRRYAREHSVPLSQVTDGLVQRTLDARTVLANVAGIRSDEPRR
ncbi:GAF and ANTAR domain-containing protein [Rhodococcus sp. NPDC076796]|uniref:GAF and ANTAR domain-containing protein n=1 Tax=Rhodococcus sp. NPDC076796 TaxID=3154859 RepID=UPI0034500EF5